MPLHRRWPPSLSLQRFFLLVLLSLPARPLLLHAENGDVLAVSAELSGKELTDIAFDSSPNPPGGSFWVLGKLTGKIYQFSADLGTLIKEIDNPHGVGSIPNFVLSWGLAYRPATRSLFVLAQDAGKWVVREVNVETGAEVLEGSFEVHPPDAGMSALRGLTYDTIDGRLWYLDANNDKVVQTDFSGTPTAQFQLQGPVAGKTLIRGEGIAFELEETAPALFEPRLYVAYGDIFSSKPNRIIQVTTSGETTGVEIPLGALESATVRGLQTQRFGLQRRMVVVSVQGDVAKLEQVIPDPVPPSNLACSLTLSNKVELSWTNNGAGVEGAYGGEITVLRNSAPLATVPGTATSFTDTTPLEGHSEYSLQASEPAERVISPPSFPCGITVGLGGLVDWAPFDGNSIYDVATDPATGDIFVTDATGTGGKGRVLRYDSELNLVGELESPWERSGGIAFVPHIEIDNLGGGTVSLDNVLAVHKLDGLLVSLVDLAGTVKTSFSLGLDVSDPQLGGLTYLPETQEFAVVELTSHQIVILDHTGRQLRTCVPADLFGLPFMDLGVTYDPLRQTFVAIFQDAFAREIFSGGACVPADFEFPLSSLGEDYTAEGFTGGIQISGNTLLIASRQSNALFRILVFPHTPSFVRGDTNGDAVVNTTDAVDVARYLFQDGPQPACQDAADANDDAVLDVSDPIYLLFYLFLGGQQPPPPFPDAGTDPTFRDNLGCDE